MAETLFPKGRGPFLQLPDLIIPLDETGRENETSHPEDGVVASEDSSGTEET